MTYPSSGPDQPEYHGPPLPHEVPPHQFLPPEALPPQVYLPYPAQPTPPRRGQAKKIIAGAAVLAVLAGGAVAGYAYSVLASGGIQPERVLPATTVAFAKLDLDPAAGQKIAAYRLSGKFPAVSKGAPNIDAEKDALLSALFSDQSDFDYATEIKPWLGDRVAVAAVPDTASEAGLDPVLAVAYKDESKMKAALDKVARTDKNFGYVTVDGYALLSDSQPHAEAVLAGVRRATLSSVKNYQADLESLHGDQVAVGWADIAATVAALQSGSGSATKDRLHDLQNLNALSATTGRIVVGAHVSSDYLEVSAVSHQTAAAGTPRVAAKPVDGTLAKLSAEDTSAALEVSGLGEALSAAWAGASATLGLREQFEDLVAEAGLRMPEDLAALFGTDTTISARLPRGTGGDPEIAAQITTNGADRAIRLLDSLGAAFGLPPDSLHAQRTAAGYLLSNSTRYDPRAPAGVRTLGDDPTFQKAVPDRAEAGLIGYVDLGRILDADPHVTAKDKSDWKHLGAFGISVVPTSDGTRTTLRLTTR